MRNLLEFSELSDKMIDMPTIKDITKAGLHRLMEQGQQTLPVDDSARKILRGWLVGKPAEPPNPAPPELQSVEEKLAYLRERAETWAPARRMGSLRDTMVFAVGNPHARLVLVGEAPGYDEERRREPFVGKAGQKLNDILRAMGLSREEIYITNICKFRPSMGPAQGTGNRPPSEEEIAACLPIVMAELRAIQPECIICLGATAARGLLGSGGSVSSLRGKWWESQGIPVRVTYHPSYLLRNEALSARRAVWEDMLAAMEQLRLPISPKQRGYFLQK